MQSSQLNPNSRFPGNRVSRISNLNVYAQTKRDAANNNNKVRYNSWKPSSVCRSKRAEFVMIFVDFG